MSGSGPQYTVLLHADAVSAAEDSGKAGPLGLLVLILLGLASYFLFRSMSRHLRKVREDFPRVASPGPQPPAAARREPAQPRSSGADESSSSAEPPRSAEPPSQ